MSGDLALKWGINVERTLALAANAATWSAIIFATQSLLNAGV